MATWGMASALQYRRGPLSALRIAGIPAARPAPEFNPEYCHLSAGVSVGAPPRRGDAESEGSCRRGARARQALAAFLRELLRPEPVPGLLPDLPLGDIPFAVIDTELTGLDPRRDSIVSIAAVAMTGTRIELGRAFHRRVRPRTDLRRDAILVHGITPRDVELAPPLAEVFGEFRAFCDARCVAGHFLAIDLAFLRRESGPAEAAAMRRRAVDTASIHGWVENQRLRHADGAGVDAGDRSLAALAAARGIGVARAHDALRDAFITAQLLQRQLRELPAHGVGTLRDLLRVARP